MKIKIYIILFIALISYAFARIKEEKVQVTELKKFNCNFIPNKGQWNSSIKFISQTRNYTLFFSNNTLFLKSDSTDLHELYKLKFLNPNLNDIEFKNPSNYYVNYFIGNNSKNWISNIHSYQKIIIKNIYPKIDLIFYFENSSFKYDFVLKKGANPDDIKLVFNENSVKKIIC